MQGSSQFYRMSGKVPWLLGLRHCLLSDTPESVFRRYGSLCWGKVGNGVFAYV